MPEVALSGLGGQGNPWQVHEEVPCHTHWAGSLWPAYGAPGTLTQWMEIENGTTHHPMVPLFGFTQEK